MVAQGARPDGAGRRAAHPASASSLALADPLLASSSGCELYLSRGAMQGRVLQDAFRELTDVYHAQNAEPAVKPPQVDPTDPPGPFALRISGTGVNGGI